IEPLEAAEVKAPAAPKMEAPPAAKVEIGTPADRPTEAQLPAPGESISAAPAPVLLPEAKPPMGGLLFLREGSNLRGHVLLKRIGEGAFADVWKARRAKDGREVAVKVPRQSLHSDQS